ncbi:hypothetical protein [Microbacterium sp. Leaf320]|uniref:hypothetical protein n=1 Tax=Microbacterium sp. Leaf320 TaxID=1736334 RepID=UPI0007012243|nr:hypothetical protein [Microbacterium sp. Leaf320]KQQ65198.1 hypothetical protein ASF63_14670 [Microbacterium sp. Leaf320]
MSHLIQANDGGGITIPLAVAGYVADKAARTAVHDTLDGGVGVAYRVAAPRTGTLTLAYDVRADAWAAYTLLGRACPFQYSGDIAALGMTFAVKGTLRIEQDGDNTDVWYVDVPYQEVPA